MQAESATPLRIYLTGRVCLERDRVLLDERRLGGRQGRLAFVYLVSERHRAVARDELAAELWPAAPPPSAERALNAIVSRVRTALEGAGLPPTALASAFGCYRLHLPAGTWVDVEAAAHALDQAESALRAGDPKHAWGWASVPYYVAQRPFLAGEEGPWASRQRAALRGLFVRATECVGLGWLANGEPGLAAKLAAEVVALEPFRETGYQLLMRAHAAAGNRAEALRVYARCRALLADELGVPPSPETEAVYLVVLRS
jgi:DNA-binding SARP family transcriptional activator